jgi:hypothetical protein
MKKLFIAPLVLFSVFASCEKGIKEEKLEFLSNASNLHEEIGILHNQALDTLASVPNLQKPVKLTTLNRFNLTTPNRFKLTRVNRVKLTT